MCLYTVSQKDAALHSCITMAYVNRFLKFFHSWIQQRICNRTLVIFPPHLTYVATLQNLKSHFCHFPTTAATKTCIYLLVNVIRIIWYILPQHVPDSTFPVRDLLRVRYLPADVSSLSVHTAASVTVSPISAFWNGRHHVHFIRPVAQHPDMNPMNYKICLEMQQQVYLRKVCNTNGPTLWPGWHGFDLSVISNATNEWCKRLQVCVHVKGRLSE